MLEYILFGGGYALAAAIQPGPLQAYFLSSVAQKGWKRTLPASLSPLLSDGPIAILVLFVINRFPENVGRVLQGAGGIFLIYLAWKSYRQWQQQDSESSEDSNPIPGTLLQAAMVNLLNPHPYLGWSLVLGPAVLLAWKQDPLNAAALLIAFYATMTIVLALTILLFGTTQMLGQKGRRTLILISSLLLAMLGIYQLTAAIVKMNLT